MIVTLPFPNAKLNPNNSKGVHWAATAILRKRAHADAWVLAKDAAFKALWKPTADTIALDITFVQPDRRRRDRDNLLAALKCSLDGVAAALGIDDSQFEPVTIRRAYGTKPGEVRIHVAEEKMSTMNELA